MFRLKLAIDKKDIDFLYEVRTHPSVDKMLSGTAPKNLTEHYAYIKKNQGTKRIIFVALNDDALIGYSQIYDIKENQLEVGFALHPDFHGKGLGKKLVQETLKEAKELFKDKKIVLYVKENNHVAINVYKKNGFKVKGKVDDLIYMEK